MILSIKNMKIVLRSKYTLEKRKHFRRMISMKNKYDLINNIICILLGKVVGTYLIQYLCYNTMDMQEYFYMYLIDCNDDIFSQVRPVDVNFKLPFGSTPQENRFSIMIIKSVISIDAVLYNLFQNIIIS